MENCAGLGWIKAGLTRALDHVEEGQAEVHWWNRRKVSEKHKLRKIKKGCGFYSYCLFLPFALSYIVARFIIFLSDKRWHYYFCTVITSHLTAVLILDLHVKYPYLANIYLVFWWIRACLSAFPLKFPLLMLMKIIQWVNPKQTDQPKDLTFQLNILADEALILKG